MNCGSYTVVASERVSNWGSGPTGASGVSRSYRLLARGSILLTSNRAPEESPDLFGEPLLAAAGLDRLTHQAQVVVITGTSFRAHGPKKEVPIEPTPA